MYEVMGVMGEIDFERRGGGFRECRGCGEMWQWFDVQSKHYGVVEHAL